jgi:hypothetical protein
VEEAQIYLVQVIDFSFIAYEVEYSNWKKCISDNFFFSFSFLRPVSHRKAVAWMTSDNATGCIQMVEETMLQQTPVPSLYPNTRACLATSPTTEYYNDPCCNPQ